MAHHIQKDPPKIGITGTLRDKDPWASDGLPRAIRGTPDYDAELDDAQWVGTCTMLGYMEWPDEHWGLSNEPIWVRVSDVDEVDRLRAENERLLASLRRILSIVGEE